MSESRFPWRTLLFVSVAVNLLVVGAVAGAWSAGVRLEREAGQQAIVDRMPGPRAFLGALPPETRAVMREQLADSLTQTREARQAATQARRDAFAAAETEPFDAPRVRAAFERVRAADQAVVGVFQNDVIEAFGELTPEQRRDVLAALRSAAPARREGAMAPAQAEGAIAPERLSPEQRQEFQERRQERRERWRERRQERLRQQDPQP
ncbi:periplasmic heavy metal sensor [Candidatus Viadribacter manganicus]|uniref:Periplasmic heavy metal sensor n=1 Tax=Candidatus Viadribacter manganicus TaxID=1759059 RepID=A0A1B1AEA0_9PROT|nr:periplasmic heavy metal sensor [Candidatus Viadribacter manganicus]ANP44883.1 hypothetical protein ATE48_02560 [Candidatus Viadribacter manganicus]